MPPVKFKIASIHSQREKNINYLKKKIEFSNLLNLKNISSEKLFKIVKIYQRLQNII